MTTATAKWGNHTEHKEAAPYLLPLGCVINTSRKGQAAGLPEGLGTGTAPSKHDWKEMIPVFPESGHTSGVKSTDTTLSCPGRPGNFFSSSSSSSFFFLRFYLF